MPTVTRAWVYKDNLGVEWLVKAKREIVAQMTGGTNSDVKVGGRAPNPGEPLRGIPNELKPRGVYVQNAAGISRFVTCYTFDAPLMTGTPPPGDVLGNATEITLRDGDGATSTYFRQQPREEFRGRIGRKTAA